MFLRKYKSLMLPVAIIFGVLFYKPLHLFIDFVPFLIFIILSFAYSALHFRRLRFTRLNFLLLVFHLVLSIVVYGLCTLFFKPFVAQGVLVGIICPVAAASSAVVSALGGNREISIVHTLTDNAMAAFVAPLMFSLAESSAHLGFIQSSLILMAKVFPVTILPVVLIVFLRRFAPRTAYKVAQYEYLSIVLWSLALMINFATTTHAVLHMGTGLAKDIVLMVVLSLLMCFVQFFLGRKLGARYKQSIVGGQALGQKNTGLAIWMAYTYFSNPLTTIYSAGYSLWQNVFNSLQMYAHDLRHKSK